MLFFLTNEQKENIFTKIKNNIRLLDAYGKPVFDSKYREAIDDILRLITIIENNEDPNNMIDYRVSVMQNDYANLCDGLKLKKLREIINRELQCPYLSFRFRCGLEYVLNTISKLQGK